MDAPRSPGQAPHKPLPAPPTTSLRTGNSDLYHDFAETDSDSSEKGSLSSSQQAAARRALWNKLKDQVDQTGVDNSLLV